MVKTSWYIPLHAWLGWAGECLQFVCPTWIRHRFSQGSRRRTSETRAFSSTGTSSDATWSHHGCCWKGTRGPGLWGSQGLVTDTIIRMSSLNQAMENKAAKCTIFLQSCSAYFLYIEAFESLSWQSLQCPWIRVIQICYLKRFVDINAQCLRIPWVDGSFQLTRLRKVKEMNIQHTNFLPDWGVFICQPGK